MKTIKFLSILAMVALLFACNKKDDNETKSGKLDDATVKELILADTLSAEFDLSLFTGLNARSSKSADGYPAFTFSPGQIKIDYGFTGCVCSDGKVRTGTVTITCTDLIPKVGTVYAITAAHTVNGYTISGEVSKTVSAVSPLGFITKAIISEDFSITKPNSQDIIARHSSITRSFLDNGNFKYTLYTYGTVGLTVNGVTKSYTTSENKKLEYKTSACEIVSGVMELKIDNKETIWTIDFGNGTPDHKATVSNGTDTWEVRI